MVKVALIFYKGFLFHLIPNCAMLPGRKEKRLLHFKFHAAGAAKGSSFSFFHIIFSFNLRIWHYHVKKHGSKTKTATP